MVQSVAPGRVLMQSKQVATMLAERTNNINPHRRMIMDLFAIPLLHAQKREFLERASERGEFKEHMLWDRSDSSDADIYGLLRYELQELNKQAGIHDVRRNTYRKQGDLYGDWTPAMARHWTTNKALSSTVSTPLSSALW